MSEPFQLRHPSITVGIIAFIVSVVLFATLAFTCPNAPRHLHGCHLVSLEITGIPPKDMTSNASFCFLHDTPIYSKSVPIVYGLLEGPFPSEQDYRKFPFGSTWIAGGCIEYLATHAIVSQCEKCVKLRLQWNSAFPSDQKFDAIRPIPAMTIPAISFDEMIIPCYVIE